jgi:hypothetical protein
MSDQPPQPKYEPLEQGDVCPTDTFDQIAATMERVFDYRGDVTVSLADGRELSGYVYDRTRDGRGSVARMMLSDGGGKAAFRYEQVTRVVVSGRDPASGRSWETWVKKYNEAKARGESAEMKPMPLEDDE